MGMSLPGFWGRFSGHGHRHTRANSTLCKPCGIRSGRRTAGPCSVAWVTVQFFTD